MVTVNTPNRLAPESAATEFKGLSTDEKPTQDIKVNSLFLELDTGDFYYYTGETWSKVGG